MVDFIAINNLEAKVESLEGRLRNAFEWIATLSQMLEEKGVINHEEFMQEKLRLQADWDQKDAERAYEEER